MDTDQENFQKVNRVRELVRGGQDPSAVAEAVGLILDLVFAQQSPEERRQALDVMKRAGYDLEAMIVAQVAARIDRNDP